MKMNGSTNKCKYVTGEGEQVEQQQQKQQAVR